jgi:hypothetical protein
MLGRSLLRNAAIVMPRMSATRYLSTSVVRRNTQDEEKAGFLKSVLYGNNEDALAPETGDATTHSKKLARGKYVHELQSKYPPSPFFLKFYFRVSLCMRESLCLSLLLLFFFFS